MDFPDRHVRVVDGVVLIEAGAPAGLRRVPQGRGVHLQLADDPARYLRHHNGVVTTGAAAIFLLG